MLTSLDHYNLETADLEGTVAFYKNVLGMTRLERPPFEDGTEGEWLGIAGRAVVHANRVADPRRGPTGSLGHVAFDAEDFGASAMHFDRTAVEYDVVDSRPAIPLRQIYVTDPNDIVIELNFRGN